MGATKICKFFKFNTKLNVKISFLTPKDFLSDLVYVSTREVLLKFWSNNKKQFGLRHTFLPHQVIKFYLHKRISNLNSMLTNTLRKV